MRVTYIDGTVEQFDGVSNTDQDENFLILQDDDEDTKFMITLSQIRKVEYD